MRPVPPLISGMVRPALPLLLPRPLRAATEGFSSLSRLAVHALLVALGQRRVRDRGGARLGHARVVPLDGFVCRWVLDRRSGLFPPGIRLPPRPWQVSR